MVPHSPPLRPSFSPVVNAASKLDALQVKLADKRKAAVARNSSNKPDPTKLAAPTGSPTPGSATPPMEPAEIVALRTASWKRLELKLSEAQGALTTSLEQAHRAREESFERVQSKLDKRLAQLDQKLGEQSKTIADKLAKTLNAAGATIDLAIAVSGTGAAVLSALAGFFFCLEL